MVNMLSYIKERKNITNNTMARYSRFVVSDLRPTSVSDLDH